MLHIVICYVNLTAVECFSAVQGTIYLGHGWLVPPHWNASKGAVTVSLIFSVFFPSLSDFLTGLSLAQWAVMQLEILQVLQGQNTHLPLWRTECSSSLVCSYKHSWFVGVKPVRDSVLIAALCVLFFSWGVFSECAEIWRMPLTFECVALCHGGGLLLPAQSTVSLQRIQHSY